jgi:type III restriction enzyme
VEIKGDEELTEPSEENRKKAEYAMAHFERVNRLLEERGDATRYKFTFLTPRSFGAYFANLREARIEEFRSELDVHLTEDA